MGKEVRSDGAVDSDQTSITAIQRIRESEGNRGGCVGLDCGITRTADVVDVPNAMLCRRDEKALAQGLLVRVSLERIHVDVPHRLERHDAA